MFSNFVLLLLMSFPLLSLLIILLLVFLLPTLLLMLTSLLSLSMLMILLLLPLSFILFFVPYFCYWCYCLSCCRRICYRCYYFADIIFGIKVIAIITFVVVDFTAIIIDIHLLAVVDAINVIVAVVAIASFLVNHMTVDTDIVISICHKTFFSFVVVKGFCCFFFLDRSIYIFDGFWCYYHFQKITFSLSSPHKK